MLPHGMDRMAGILIIDFPLFARDATAFNYLVFAAARRLDDRGFFFPWTYICMRNFRTIYLFGKDSCSSVASG